MDKKDEILKELREITPLADQFRVENPFTLPAGYFSGLPESIMARIKENSRAEADETGCPKLPVRAISPGKSQSAGSGENSIQGAVPLISAMPIDGEKTGLSAGSSGVVQSARKLLLRITMAAAIAGMLALGGWWYFNSSPEASNQIAKAGNRIDKVGNQITATGKQKKSTYIEGTETGAGGNRKAATDNEIRIWDHQNAVISNQITPSDRAAADSLLLQKMRNMGEAEILGFIESSAIPVIYGNVVPSISIKEGDVVEIGDEDIKWMLAEVSEAELQHFLEDDGDILYN